MKEQQFTMEDMQSANRKARVLDRLISKEINAEEAAKRLSLSERQIFRLLNKYRNEGIAGLIHGNKLRPTNTGYDDDFKDQIVATYLGVYEDYNFSHFMDKLLEDYNLRLSLSFIRSVLMARGITSPRRHRHKRTPHPPRERKTNAGELVQVDASKFQWLIYNGDNQYYYLHGMIDDATTTVSALWLEEQETNHGYQECMRQTIKNYGIPAWLYTDNRGTFTNNQKLTIEEELDGKEVKQTRFVEMLERLGVGITTTSVPEAKGRIERLWNTLQDRLPKDLGKAGITNIKEANQYIQDVFLPRYNDKFASPIDCNRNYFQKVQKGFDYNTELALIYQKRIYNGTYLQLDKKNYAIFLNGKNIRLNVTGRITIYRCLDGELRLQYNHKWYELKPIDAITRRASPKPKHTPEELSIIRSEAARKANTPWRNPRPTK